MTQKTSSNSTGFMKNNALNTPTEARRRFLEYSRRIVQNIKFYSDLVMVTSFVQAQIASMLMMMVIFKYIWVVCTRQSMRLPYTNENRRNSIMQGDRQATTMLRTKKNRTRQEGGNGGRRKCAASQTFLSMLWLVIIYKSQQSPKN